MHSHKSVRKEVPRKKEDELLVLRPTTTNDVDALAEIEKQLFSDAWSKQSIWGTIQSPSTTCITAEKDGRIVGYVFLYLLVDEVEIANIAVAGDMHRQGVGSHLMLAVEEICEKEAMKKIFLEVRESNVSARAFYTDCGFEQDDIRKSYYSNPTEDAVLMSRVVSAHTVPCKR